MLSFVASKNLIQNSDLNFVPFLFLTFFLFHMSISSLPNPHITYQFQIIKKKKPQKKVKPNESHGCN